MKTITKQFTLVILLLVTNVTLANAQTIGGRSDPSEKQIEGLLQRSGLKYKKAGAGLWVINRSGKSRGSFQIVIASAPTLMMVESVVAVKKNLDPSKEMPAVQLLNFPKEPMAVRLLRLAYNLDHVKVALDGDGDLFVRSEVRLKLLDVEELNATIDRVASACDRVHEQIKSPPR